MTQAPDPAADLLIFGGQPFTAAQAADAGLPGWRLTRMVESRRLRRLLRNVYVGPSVPDSLELRCDALRLVVPKDAFISDTTAAWLYVGDKALPPGAHLEVPTVSCFRPSDHGRLRNDVTSSGERAIVASDLQEVHGLVVTKQLRTAIDLGRLQPTADMRLWGMSCLLGLGEFTEDELRLQVRRFARQRGVVLLRELVPRVDPGLESFAEAALCNRWHDAGLPRPETQVEVERGAGRAPYAIDLGLPERRFGAEYYGEDFHSSDQQVEHDEQRLEWLRRERSWLLEPYLKHHVFGPFQNAERRLRDAYDDLLALGPRTFIL
jgi:hypothetical protein